MLSPPEIGSSPNSRGETGNYLPDRYPRSLGQGGKSGRRSGRTPCLPDRLPDWVPVTVSHRSGPRGDHP